MDEKYKVHGVKLIHDILFMVGAVVAFTVTFIGKVATRVGRRVGTFAWGQRLLGHDLFKAKNTDKELHVV